MCAVMNEQNKWGPKPGQLEAVASKLMQKHVDEDICYTTCTQNGCFDMCLLRVHTKDGIATAIETDNLIHTNCGREDEYIDFDEYRQGMYQRRACVRGRGWRKDIYSPNRLKYPLLRVGPRGSRQFKRISWDEALNLVAQKYVETREKYGPHSVWSDGMLGISYDYFGSYLPGGGLGGWAIDSFEPNEFADGFMLGKQMKFWEFIAGEYWTGSEGMTFFDSKLIILWGCDILLNVPENAYYLVLAKKLGIPIIYIDPRHTWTAQFADQWIPIRPGTDGAMLEAMGYILFEEDLYNHEFVEKWIEPYGLQRWKDYLYGADDGIVKTPEWAEAICGVPAETIVELTRLYAKSHPVYTRQVWAAARMLGGENQARTFQSILAMCANLGHKGTIGTNMNFGMKARFPVPGAGDIGMTFGQYGDKCLVEAELWYKAVLLHEDLEAGLITEDEYKAEIGCPLDEPAPNIKMLFYMQNNRTFTENYQDANGRIEAVKKLDFVVYAHYDMSNSAVWYSDVVLPLAHQFLEGGVGNNNFLGGGYNFENGMNANAFNAFMGVDKVVDPPGEARHKLWIAKEVANRLGIGDLFAPKIKDTPWEDFFPTMRELAKGSYENWMKLPEIVPMNPPTWEEFNKDPFFRFPIEGDYQVACRENFENDIPFDTDSGQIEFYSSFLANSDLTRQRYFSKCFGKGKIEPLAKYKTQPISMLSKKVKEYPLYLITPHSFFRQHFTQDSNEWFRDEYRTSVWISAPDAKTRGIKDGDLVFCHNDLAEALLPAYVTSRLMPGVCCLIFGRHYQPSKMKTEKMPEGIDRAGCCNFFTSNEHYDYRRGILLNNGLCDISKAEFELTGIME